MKKTLAMLLVLVMVVSMFPTTIFAAADESHITLSVDKTEVEIGDTVIVTLGIKEMTGTSLAFGFDFDTTLLEATSVPTKTKVGIDFATYDPDTEGELPDEYDYEDALAATTISTKKNLNDSGHFGVAYAYDLPFEALYYEKDAVVTIKFTALAAGTVKFQMFEDSAGTDGYKGEWTAEQTVTIKEAAAECQHANTTTTTVDATCSATGSKTVVCDDCGETVSTETLPVLDHEYFNACDAYCMICNEKTNPAAAHSIKHVEAKDPVSCIEYGNVEYWYCEYCGAAWLDADCMMITNMMSVRVAGECVSDAEYACQDGVCVKCGLPVDAEADHTEATKIETVTEPTCDTAGTFRDIVYCSVCGETISTGDVYPGAPAGHSWGATSYNWTADNASCEATRVCEKGCEETTKASVTSATTGSCEAGNKVITYTATFSESWAETQTKEVEGGHSIEHVEAKVPANCQETGHSEYWYCADCDCYFGDAEASYQINPAWITYTGDHVRPENSIPCAVVKCEVCGEDSYGTECDRGDAPVCQDAPCVNCGETVWGWGCNYNTGDEETPLPLCQPGTCVYCGKSYDKLYDCENGSWAPCLDGECSYGCGKQFPATAEHEVEDPCAGGFCTVCWNEIAPAHEYLYACDAHCMNCGELTNPDAKHDVTYVEANPGANCQEWGTVEFWGCNICGSIWLDEALTLQTSRLAIYAPGPHADATYTDNGDGTHTGKCALCGVTVGETAAHEYVDYVCVCDAKYTGWDGKTYIKEAELQKTGWTEIDGAWYYLNTETGIRAEGLSRVPYPTAAINGITYAPDAEAMAYCESKGETFIDATKAWFQFDLDGKFLYGANGFAANGGKLVNGMLAWHPGLIEVAEGEYMYFIGDVVNGGNTPANGDTWITKNNGIEAFAIGDVYNFVDGQLSGAHGVVDGKYYQNSKLMMGYGLVETENGFIYVRTNGYLATGKYYISNTANYDGDALAYGDGVTFGADGYAINGIYNEKYYVNGKVAYGAGVVKTDEGYIYVRSNGVVVMGTAYWITNVGTSGLVAKSYEFDDEGIILNPEFVTDAQKNGVVDGYYYENGNVVYGAGLIEYNGGIIYVRSNGQVATGKYWVTNTNGLKEANYYTFGDDGMLIN